jgi:hypothetical protein
VDNTADGKGDDDRNNQQQQPKPRWPGGTTKEGNVKVSITIGNHHRAGGDNRVPRGRGRSRILNRPPRFANVHPALAMPLGHRLTL